MPNFCPGCGAKLNEGYKYCLSCGAQLQTEDTTNQDIPNQQDAQVPPTQQPISQEGYTQPSQPRKSKKILFISLIAIIAIIIIVIVVIIFSGGGYRDNRFVGEWEQSEDGMMSISWVFGSDGSLEIMGMDIATWSVKSDMLCLKTNEFWGEFMPEGSLDEVCYNFEFSDGGNIVTLSQNGSEYATLTKT